eukprot:6211254-Pleurochrysis_carterae.AAC.3
MNFSPYFMRACLLFFLWWDVPALSKRISFSSVVHPVDTKSKFDLLYGLESNWHALTAVGATCVLLQKCRFANSAVIVPHATKGFEDAPLDNKEMYKVLH